jgi:hypothetical protein
LQGIVMTNLATQSGFDAESYLGWEEQQPEKHECLDCDIQALGVSVPFDEIFGNVGPDDSRLDGQP